MRIPGVPYKPRYSGDEIALGLVSALVLHFVAIGPFVVKALLPAGSSAEEQPPAEGHADGVDGGTEMDRRKVRAGDVYPGMLSGFLHGRWQLPSVISVGEASKLCVPVQIATTRDMKVWNVSVTGSSGNDLF